MSRVVADTSLVFAGLVPWNMLAILCSTVIGIPTVQYLPYAVFLWLLPLLTVCLSFSKRQTGEVRPYTTR
ncbi:Na+/H+ antiporter NhaC family protein [Aneurinibacillus terranovensis]|uniref:Na+/H+ antiporter NhaC family protein n=1 Tax=Aneurinibacillus terranovensis TaxID=278991 RepID=UPI0012DE4978